MTEQITITFGANMNVECNYQPSTPEATPTDQLLAYEIAIHTLIAVSMQMREQLGRPLRPELMHLFNAHTFHELM